MMARIRSLAVTPSGRSPSTSTAMVPGRCWGRVWVARTCSTSLSADAEGEGAEGPVGGGVAVAAHDGHAGQGQPLLGADHVDDALAGAAHRVLDDAELGGVGPQHLDLLARDRVGDRLVDVGGGDVVVLGGDGQVGAAHGAPVEAEAVERLRRGDLVHEVEVDVEQVGLALGPVHDVALPDLVAEGPGLGHGGVLPSGVGGGWWVWVGASAARPATVTSVSYVEMLVSTHGKQCRQRRRARQGGRHPRRARSPDRAAWRSWWPRPASPGPRPTAWPPPWRRTGWCGATTRAASRSGARLLALGRAAAAALPLAAAAEPALVELRDLTGESVQLYVRDGDHRVCVAALESPHGLRTIVPLGARLPLGVGSGGRLLSGETPAGRAGWVQSVGEREAGVASVSAPVLDDRGRVRRRGQRVGPRRADLAPARTALRRGGRGGRPPHRAGRRLARRWGGWGRVRGWVEPGPSTVPTPA